MRLSIITINYNNASGLQNTLKSVTPNCGADVELIVIDGGSTDESVEVIHSFKDKISYWVSESDKGVYHAMNKGIERADGEYIMFINSGDSLMVDVNMKNVLKDVSGEDIIYHNLEIVDAVHCTIKKYPSKLDFKYFLQDTIPHIGTLIKKELFSKYGLYNEKFKIVSDWAFFMDCVLIHNCSYKYIDSCFATFRLDGISSAPENYKLLWQEKEEHIKSHYPLYYSLYKEWMEKKDELYKLKSSVSVRYLKKLGFLKWLKL